jgi:hypothetical protein
MPSADTYFQNEGKGTKNTLTPISVRFSAEIDPIVRSLPNRQDYIRQAVEEKLRKDGLIQ